MPINKTTLLPIYSIQTNMVMAYINPNNTRQCKVLLATGKIITYDCNTINDAMDIHDKLHYSKTDINRNNSMHMGFTFEQWIE